LAAGGPSDPDVRGQDLRRLRVGRHRQPDQRRAGAAALNHRPHDTASSDKDRDIMGQLQISGLTVEIEGQEILHGLDLVLAKGETHALMGPNGSGKSTLAYAIAGHPAYEITGGQVTIDGTDILELTPDERAQLGLFLAMQYPTEIP